jgi:hypothetical protein
MQDPIAMMNDSRLSKSREGDLAFFEVAFVRGIRPPC